MAQPEITGYSDERHAEVVDDLIVGEHGYKYRLLDGVVMPPYITPERYGISRQLETRAGDICYVSYPKSGSTWLSYILLLLTTGGVDPDDRTLRDCLQWVASSYTYPRSPEELDSLPSPRIFKSHMPYQMALGGVPRESPCKYIYVGRNPKDVVVSYFHFEREKSWSGQYDGDWPHWLQMFIDGRVQRGDWFDHVLSWWAERDADNILFLQFEDLVNDFDAQLERLATFLSYELTDELRTTIRERTSFRQMKKSSFSNLNEIAELDEFFRKGKIGSWKQQFTVAQNDWFDSLYEQRMKRSQLEFQFEGQAEIGGRS